MSEIEKSVTRITVWHHKACRVNTDSDSDRQIFLSAPHTNDRPFFLLAIQLNFYLKLNSLKVSEYAEM